MANFLVVGGAGYIGSHVVKALGKKGYDVVVLDNLSEGHRNSVSNCEFIQGDLGDTPLLKDLFSSKNIDCVMHFAAFCYVGESVVDPRKYYRNNVVNALNLLEAMVEHNAPPFIFSSSCATYGVPLTPSIDETHSQHPVNPYGRTKYMIEQVLHDFGIAYGLRSISLRYFNASGADESGNIGEYHRPETHLIPLLLQVALGQREDIEIFGTDWDTPDGTCIRDYVHVTDLANAHVLAAERLLDGAPSAAYNLGCEAGYSVKELVEIARKVTGHSIPVREVGRRAGDPERLVASSEKIRKELGWSPRYDDPEKIVATAWEWHRRHPDGYED